jgi:hypothetical protein
MTRPAHSRRRRSRPGFPSLLSLCSLHRQFIDVFDILLGGIILRGACAQNEQHHRFALA